VGNLKKKIDVGDLEIGMCVIELDRPWLETPMLFQGYEIHNQGEIDELRRYCKFVYITVLQLVSPSKTPAPVPVRSIQHRPAAKGTNDLHHRIEFDLLKKAAAPQHGDQPYPDQTTLEEELGAAQTTHAQARSLVSLLLDDARMLKSLDIVATKQVVGALAESVLRNPDALLCLMQLKNKHEFTAEHSLRVSVLALTLGRHLGLDSPELQNLGTGALLHDIGKMKLPLDLLQQSGKLAPHDVEILQHHVPLGVALLRRQPGIPQAAVEAVREHHERYNGSGYPAGLKGNAIGQLGQIVGIVDYYDTMTSDWVDHSALSGYMAIRKIYELRDEQFHHTLVNQFIQCMGIYPIGSLVEFNTGEVGVVVSMNRHRRLRPRVALVLRANNTPYEEIRIINLMHDRASDGRVLEIERALEPGTYGIKASDYLPQVARA
jgi:putative nucleotidyltransferase with HDIG domain